MIDECSLYLLYSITIAKELILKTIFLLTYSDVMLVSQLAALGPEPWRSAGGGDGWLSGHWAAQGRGALTFQYHTQGVHPQGCGSAQQGLYPVNYPYVLYK